MEQPEIQGAGGRDRKRSRKAVQMSLFAEIGELTHDEVEHIAARIRCTIEEGVAY